MADAIFMNRVFLPSFRARSFCYVGFVRLKQFRLLDPRTWYRWCRRRRVGWHAVYGSSALQEVRYRRSRHNIVHLLLRRRDRRNRRYDHTRVLMRMRDTVRRLLTADVLAIARWAIRVGRIGWAELRQHRVPIWRASGWRRANDGGVGGAINTRHAQAEVQRRQGRLRL